MAFLFLVWGIAKPGLGDGYRETAARPIDNPTKREHSAQRWHWNRPSLTSGTCGFEIRDRALRHSFDAPGLPA
jgi:hypothetical protein